MTITSTSFGVRPLTDWVLVKRFEYEHPVLAVVGVELQKGEIIAVGPGKRQKRKVRFDLQEGHLSASRALYFEDGEETGKVWPNPFKPGDIVEFSPRNQIEWVYNGERYVWIKQKSIYGKSNDSRSDALLWQQPGGTDYQGNWLPDSGQG